MSLENFNPIKSLFARLKYLEEYIRNQSEQHANIALSLEPDEEKDEVWFDGFRSACVEIAKQIREKNNPS